MMDRTWLERPIHWRHTADPLVPYAARDGDQLLELRLGDFPAEELYTLLVDGVEVLSFSQWPDGWARGDYSAPLS
jgi:hypothetical protein